MIVVQKITYTRLCSLLDDEGNRCTSHHDQANHCECYRTHTTGGRKLETLVIRYLRCHKEMINLIIIHTLRKSNWLCIC